MDQINQQIEQQHLKMLLTRRNVILKLEPASQLDHEQVKLKVLTRKLSGLN